MKCEFEPLNNLKVQVKLSKQILYRKAAWLKTLEVILAIEGKNDSHNNVILINFKN